MTKIPPISHPSAPKKERKRVANQNAKAEPAMELRANGRLVDVVV